MKKLVKAVCQCQEKALKTAKKDEKKKGDDKKKDDKKKDDKKKDDKKKDDKKKDDKKKDDKKKDDKKKDDKKKDDKKKDDGQTLLPGLHRTVVAAARQPRRPGPALRVKGRAVKVQAGVPFS